MNRRRRHESTSCFAWWLANFGPSESIATSERYSARRIHWRSRAAQHAVRSRAYAALAVEASTARERRKWWQEALRSSRREMVESPGFDAVRRRALLAVDATSDRLAAFELNECHRELAAVTRDLDEVLSHSEDPYCRSALLAAKAMVLRHRGNHERLPTPRDTFLDSSVRCAEAAVREHPLPASVLQLGLCLGQRSGTTKDLERRQQMAGEAEGHLIRAVERGAGEVGRLALASFYRHMHRPLDAVDAFPLDGPHANYRRVLRAAPVLAEAAIELHYNGYPYGVVERALEDARALLDDAHRGGYGWARHLVDLAVVRAILDGPSPHETVLGELLTSRATPIGSMLRSWRPTPVSPSNRRASRSVSMTALCGIGLAPMRSTSSVMRFSPNGSTASRFGSDRIPIYP